MHSEGREQKQELLADVRPLLYCNLVQSSISFIFLIEQRHLLVNLIKSGSVLFRWISFYSTFVLVQLTLSLSSMVAGNFSTKNLQEFEECLRCSVWAVTTSTLPPGLPSQTCEAESGQSDRELQQNKVYFLQQQEIICKCLISLSMILTTVVTKVNI